MRAQTACMTSVYLVDDSHLIRDRLRSMLAALPGVQTIGEAAGADEAIAGILSGRPQVVLLDVALAQGSGFDVLRAVRDEAPEIDVFMLSNLASYPYRDLAQRLGARGYFDKSRELARVCDVFRQDAPCQPSPAA
jgi:DNA-binding NarL/FixJ family response regulator